MAATALFLGTIKYLAGSKGDEKKREDAWHEKRLNDEAAARVGARFATKKWKDEHEVRKNYRSPAPPKYPLEEDDRAERRNHRWKFPTRSEYDNRMEDRRSEMGLLTSRRSYDGRSDARRSSARNYPSERSYLYAGTSSSGRSYNRAASDGRPESGRWDERHSTRTYGDGYRHFDDRSDQTYGDYRQDRAY